ncbi:argininosuccinate lyase [Harpegnathos saltator]|uniref:Arginosuccinase n=1 Tax=Harpegnathos saltator TaxID=610380 RepID=E2BEB7_HARSA|nr:argininosuccinate lyase [Harpegnathos saltator]EFN85962.1 Argininosuccinate lyase [Harpegnathos saltator]
MDGATSRTSQKLWGGRFVEDVDPDFHGLNASIDVDKRMYAEDIQGSIAYANALCEAKLLSQEETQAISTALKQVQTEWENGEFVVKPEDEDIHSANERRLSELIGDIAKKLHTGRSRNDQTATDTKLWLRKSIDKLLLRLRRFVEVLVIRAEQDADVLMAGYTHMQRAQPVRWSQWLLSYAWYAKQDVERLREVRKRVNIMPLGSGAIAGNPFPIDRRSLAAELDFDDVTENSMHAVGDRDFVAEFLFWSSLSSLHLSRFCEDLIIYSTREFNFVQFSDKYSTGSSLMPQKRNPDCMELIRGKTGTVLGKCIGFMTTLKGIPSTYNKDLQEDKEAVFHTYDTLYQMFYIAEKALATLKINRNNCKNSLTSDMLATDMAYYLVRKGIPFRESHHLAGRAVALAESKGISLQELTLQELKTISEVFEGNISCIWDYNCSVEQYKTAGGTSSEAIQQQISKLRSWLLDFPSER